MFTQTEEKIFVWTYFMLYRWIFSHMNICINDVHVTVCLTIFNVVSKHPHFTLISSRTHDTQTNTTAIFKNREEILSTETPLSQFHERTWEIRIHTCVVRLMLCQIKFLIGPCWIKKCLIGLYLIPECVIFSCLI